MLELLEVFTVLDVLKCFRICITVPVCNSSVTSVRSESLDILKVLEVCVQLPVCIYSVRRVCSARSGKRIISVKSVSTFTCVLLQC